MADFATLNLAEAAVVPRVPPFKHDHKSTAYVYVAKARSRGPLGIPSELVRNAIVLGNNEK